MPAEAEFYHTPEGGKIPLDEKEIPWLPCSVKLAESIDGGFAIIVSHSHGSWAVSADEISCLALPIAGSDRAVGAGGAHALFGGAVPGPAAAAPPLRRVP